MREDVLQRIRHYCAYQERCHEEVRSKLISLKVYADELEEVIGQMVQEDFLNEERYAKAFAGGKFRMQQWGREKIERALRQRKVSSYCIRKGIEEIDEDVYRETLQSLFEKARQKYGQGTPAQRHQRIWNALRRKGYEAELVGSLLRD